jgi:hypothetical protein
MICAALSGLIAALTDSEWFKLYGRPTIVFLSFLSTLAVTWLITFRHREMEDLRERGYLHLRHAISEARAALTAAKTDEDFLSIHARLRNILDRLDRQQHADAHALLGTGSLQGAGRNRPEVPEPL